jgi:hypothetical protein
MNLDEREAGLIALIDAYRDDACRTLLDAARAEAGAVLGRTYRAERDRLHTRIVAERAAPRPRIHAARAEHDTRARTGDERAATRLLTSAWPRLRQRLAARWAAPDTRRDWAVSALEQARRVLPDGLWTVRHAPGWTADEWQPLAASLAAERATEPRFIADGALTAGLTVASGGALLDASLEGLLKDRARLEARLLALLTTEPGPDERTAR